MWDAYEFWYDDLTKPLVDPKAFIPLETQPDDAIRFLPPTTKEEILDILPVENKKNKLLLKDFAPESRFSDKDLPYPYYVKGEDGVTRLELIDPSAPKIDDLVAKLRSDSDIRALIDHLLNK